MNIFQRLSEPSTYAGIAGVLAGVNTFVASPKVAAVGQVVDQAGALAPQSGYLAFAAMLAGIVAIFKPERSGQ